MRDETTADMTAYHLLTGEDGIRFERQLQAYQELSKEREHLRAMILQDLELELERSLQITRKMFKCMLANASPLEGV